MFHIRMILNSYDENKVNLVHYFPYSFATQKMHYLKFFFIPLILTLLFFK